ncbi:MAG TPA: FixH family protein [Polyangiaceae bacterium]
MAQRFVRMTAMPRRLAGLFALGAVGTLAVGCSKDNSSTPGTDSRAQGTASLCDLPAPCQKIVQACMPKDLGAPGPLHDCHLTGMVDGVEANCQKDLDNCLATCGAAPALSDGPVDDVFASCRDGGKKTVDAGSGAASFLGAALSTFMSDAKDLSIELRTSPQPIHVGPEGQGQLRISDPSTGAPVDGLEITVKTWMPVMGHTCSPVPVKVEPQGQGVYLLNPLLASMKGACELKLTFAGTRSGQAVSPTFDVPN